MYDYPSKNPGIFHNIFKFECWHSHEFLVGSDLESSVVSPRLVMAPTRELACQIQLLGWTKTLHHFWSLFCDSGVREVDFSEEYKGVMVMTNINLVDFLIHGPNPWVAGEIHISHGKNQVQLILILSNPHPHYLLDNLSLTSQKWMMGRHYYWRYKEL